MLDIPLSKYDKINVHLSHPFVTVGEELEALGLHSDTLSKKEEEDLRDGSALGTKAW